MPYFTSKGFSLYYETIGEGPPLVFLPPPALGVSAFIQQKESLKKDFQVITFDPLGTGRSSSGAEKNYSIEEWTDDLLALADHLKLDKIIPCGYSLGGLPAQLFALNYPQRTKALILTCTFPEVSTKLLAGKIKSGEWTMFEDLRGLLSRVLAITHTKRKDNQKALQKSIYSSSSEIVKNMYRSGRRFSVTGRLPEITCPVTYIYGKFDPLVRPYVKFYRMLVPDLQIVKIAGGLHQLPTRNTDELNAIIRSHYRERSAGNDQK
ncbi:alpha/beta fold hydrolase [Alkalicoccus halolimnae]|uniref:Alpha/beta hydrolase n=1 Tax=Alkalicoccus halolimnae TaxID=1667239 RepID=A0AAJ8LV51_9BACI|nr:alpha/beta hydrolase [Alkalicoccus halolimnae]